MRGVKAPASDRFWALVAVRAPDECWLWLGAQYASGYGYFTLTRPVHSTTTPAHRFAYIDKVGPVADGLELDHTCVVRLCVNPAHLEPVTQAENLRRMFERTGSGPYKTHCKNGHEYTPDNTYVRPDRSFVSRSCKACRANDMRAFYARRRGAA